MVLLHEVSEWVSILSTNLNWTNICCELYFWNTCNAKLAKYYLEKSQTLWKSFENCIIIHEFISARIVCETQIKTFACILNRSFHKCQTNLHLRVRKCVCLWQRWQNVCLQNMRSLIKIYALKAKKIVNFITKFGRWLWLSW